MSGRSAQPQVLLAAWVQMTLTCRPACRWMLTAGGRPSRRMDKEMLFSADLPDEDFRRSG